MLTLSVGKVKAGHEQTEHLTVVVKPQVSGSPLGQVTIQAGSVTICKITLKGAKGSCTLGARKLGAGTYHLVATYPGATPFAGSAWARRPSPSRSSRCRTARRRRLRTARPGELACFPGASPA